MTRTAGFGRAANIGLAVGFACLICLPAWKTFRDVLKMQPNELAALRAHPMWKLSRSSPGEFETHFDATFGLRNTLLKWFRRVKVRAMKVSTSDRVVLGENGWLFYTPVPVGEDQSTARPYEQELLSRWAGVLQARHDWLALRGIPYVLVFTPDKQSIYPELLPSCLRRRNAEASRMDQLITYLRDHTSVQVVDVRDPMRLAKTRERLYDRTDSHWNTRGAYVAYAGLVEDLTSRFPCMAPTPRHAFEEAATPSGGGDCARLLGLTRLFRETSLGLIPRTPRMAQRVHVEGPYAPDNPLRPFAMECANDALPRAVMFHDSFGAHLIPFLSEHFRRIVYAWVRPDHPIFDAELVEREQPDIVIQQIVERKLSVYCPDGDAIGDARCEMAAAWSRCSPRSE